MEFKPYWWYNEESKDMLERGYLLENQKVEDKIEKICKRASDILKRPDLKDKFKEVFEKGWASLSSPIWANFGEDRGLPISCFSSYAPDNLIGIYDMLKEVAVMTKQGGGTAGYFGDLRKKGAPINGGGKSSGAVSFISQFDKTVEIVSQSGVRRGAFAAYLDIDHPEIKELLKVKDKGNSMQTINTAVNVPDEWMESMINGDKEKRDIWATVIKSRREKGIPYIHFIDNVNNNAPDVYRDKGLKINQSNLCIIGSDRVVSEKGYLTAKELFEQDEELVLFDGNKSVKSSKMKLREKNVPVYEVSLENGMKLTATDYHGMAVMNKDRGQIERIPLKDLKIGDKIAIQTNKGLFGDVSMKDEAFLLGLYQSDGTQHKDLIMLDVWENDFDILEEVQDKFNNIHYKYKCDKYTCGNYGGIRNRKPATFFDCVVSNGDVKKKRLESKTLKKALNFEKGYVPSWIWESNEETQWEYVRGLLIADGTAFMAESEGNPLQISYSDINREFLEELQLLFTNLGLASSIHLSHKEGKSMLPDDKGGHKLYDRKECFRLVIGNKNDALCIEENTKFLSRKGVKIEDRVYRNNTKKRSKVISIKYVGEEDVYCPTVYTADHIFVANGMLTFNCAEIELSTSEEESLVCCLLSMNLYTYDDWKDTDAIELMVYFLDAVMEDFIIKASKIDGLERAVNFAKSQRALGLGVLGYHSYLQKNMIPLESFEAMQINTKIFKDLKEKSYKASEDLAKEYGEPSLLKGYGRRNTTLLALAPTTSSSSILGQVSPTIEPYKSNYFTAGLAKGSFPRKNKELKKLLESKGKDDRETWKSILDKSGSVQHLDFLSSREKDIFKTFSEISPLTIIQQASARQRFICQGQSLNLLIPNSVSIKDINKWMIEAWKLGIKALYYQRGTSVAKEAVLEMMECASCSA